MTDEFSNQAIGYIQHVLDATGMSQTALGKAAGIAASTLNRPLRNPEHQFSLSLSTIGRIAVATGIDPSPFLRTSPLNLMRRRAGLSMADLAKAAGFAGSSSVQRYCAADYNKGFRPEIAERLAGALLGRGEPPITRRDLDRLFTPPAKNLVPDGDTGTPGKSAATDLLAFLHFIRAEHRIDVPERHFETLRSLINNTDKSNA